MCDIDTMKEHDENIVLLRHMLAMFMTEQSNPRLNEQDRLACKSHIRALTAAIDAMSTQILA